MTSGRRRTGADVRLLPLQVIPCTDHAIYARLGYTPLLVSWIMQYCDDHTCFIYLASASGRWAMLLHPLRMELISARMDFLGWQLVQFLPIDVDAIPLAPQHENSDSDAEALEAMREQDLIELEHQQMLRAWLTHPPDGFSDSD